MNITPSNNNQINYVTSSQGNVSSRVFQNQTSRLSSLEKTVLTLQSQVQKLNQSISMIRAQQNSSQSNQIGNGTSVNKPVLTFESLGKELLSSIFSGKFQETLPRVLNQAADLLTSKIKLVFGDTIGGWIGNLIGKGRNLIGGLLGKLGIGGLSSQGSMLGAASSLLGGKGISSIVSGGGDLISNILGKGKGVLTAIGTAIGGPVGGLIGTGVDFLANSKIGKKVGGFFKKIF